MNKNVFITVLCISSILSIIITPFIGSSLDFSAIFSLDKESSDYFIFFNLRLPRVLLAFLAGASLSICGMCFQSLFRNDLATPFTLGVASGASFGVVFYMFIGIPILVVPFISTSSLAGFAGALLALGIVYSLIKFKRNVKIGDVLLGGIAVNLFFTSLILMIQYSSKGETLKDMVIWMMGGLQVIGYDQLYIILAFIIIGFIVVFNNLFEMDLLLTGEDMAASRGVNVRKVRRQLFIAVSMIVGAVVSVCGPIGFIGLMGPHICRRFVGSGHKKLFWASLLFGGTFLLIADTLARTLFYPTDLPVGLITSAVGGPFFFWLIMKEKN